MASFRLPTADELISEAIEKTGLSDMGPGDFRQGLEVTLDSLGRDVDPTEAGAKGVLDSFRRRLVNRLEVEAWYRDHPEIEQLTLRGPIDIHGLPRTGTTALANMMSLDPQFRCLRSWEQAKPVPPPVLADEATDPRRLAALAGSEHLTPAMKAMHLFDTDATTEDTDLLGMAFHGQQYTMPVYSYHRWWRDADMTQTYEYHRRVVKLLQSQRPPDLWLFKAPHHKFHLEPLLAAYPDMKFVMTHRDPAKVVPSYASLTTTLFPESNRERDLHKIGPEVCNHLREGMENAMAARARIGESRFFDVHQVELSADPIATLRKIYAFLGLEISSAFEEAVREWDKANHVGAHGTHEYTPEQFGLSAAQVRSDYDFYIRHFDITIES